MTLLQILEGLSYIVVIIGVGFAAYQLLLMRTSIKDNISRASTEKSIEYMNLFADKIIPLSGSLERERLKSKIYENELDSEKYLMNDFKDFKFTKEFLVEATAKGKIGYPNLLNQMEMFSAAIISGLADEKLVRVPISRIFCSMVEEQTVFLAYCVENGAPFENLRKLYKKWKSEIKTEELKLQRKAIDDKIDENKANTHDIPLLEDRKVG